MNPLAGTAELPKVTDLSDLSNLLDLLDLLDLRWQIFRAKD